MGGFCMFAEINSNFVSALSPCCFSADFFTLCPENQPSLKNDIMGALRTFPYSKIRCTCLLALLINVPVE